MDGGSALRPLWREVYGSHHYLAGWEPRGPLVELDRKR